MPRGALTFVFDDGYRDVYEQVVPLLRKYRLPAVFAVVLDHAKIEAGEQAEAAPWQNWLALKNDGHEIAAHSVTHPDFTTLAIENLATELQKPAATLGATTLVYPGGAYNRTVIAKASEYYHAARTVKKGFEKIPPTNQYELKTYNFTKHNFSVAKANALAMWACLTDQWLIETYHLVRNEESSMLHSVQLAAFERHLRFVTKLPIRVCTIAELTHL